MSKISLREATEVLLSLLRGERTWAHVGPSYEETDHGDVALRTNDGWVISLHTSYDELKHTAYMIAPDGRRGDESIWRPEAMAAGKIWGDPIDALGDAEFDHLERLAIEAPPASLPLEAQVRRPQRN